MTKSFFLSLSILFPSLLFGQTFKGTLTHDSLKNIYTYKQDCFDELIIEGAPSMINRIRDTKIYAIEIDTIYFGRPIIGSGECKTIYLCVNNSIVLQDSTIYCLTSLHHEKGLYDY